MYWMKDDMAWSASLLYTMKELDEKTLKAYHIDLNQFSDKIIISSINEINISILENYISFLIFQ